ncbi:DUF6527 family protein [Novosphingobium aquiterrae]|uniref:DUF6527 family protein n=1 Tax=Novosphingobium aquiterrae TaxID=624388 RepID=A0ABV6PM67_9SPHN
MLLDAGVVYHSEEYEIGALLCACGCGHRVSLLVPDSHRVTSEGGFATIYPSISVCDATCKSHYVIRAGRVEWLPAFSDDVAKSVMRRQIERHSERERKPQPVSWRSRLASAVAWAFDKLKTILRL